VVDASRELKWATDQATTWEELERASQRFALEKELHIRVSAFYSSIREGITRSSHLTVRQWLSTQPYQAQREFGLQAIENIKKGIWR
jgi:hypothetical protein